MSSWRGGSPCRRSRLPPTSGSRSPPARCRSPPRAGERPAAPCPRAGRDRRDSAQPRGGASMASGDDVDPRVRQLGEYIRLQRQMADLSLRGMADLTKVSNAYLSQIERGLHQPSLRVLQAIAEALNIPPDTLLAEAGGGSTEAPGGVPGGAG